MSKICEISATLEILRLETGFFPIFRQWIPKRCKGVCCVDLGESFHMSILNYFLAKFGFDAAENEPRKVWQVWQSSRAPRCLYLWISGGPRVIPFYDSDRLFISSMATAGRPSEKTFFLRFLSFETTNLTRRCVTTDLHHHAQFQYST